MQYVMCSDDQEDSMDLIWKEGRKKKEAGEATGEKDLRLGSVDLSFYLEKDRFWSTFFF